MRWASERRRPHGSVERRRRHGRGGSLVASVGLVLLLAVGCATRDPTGSRPDLASDFSSDGLTCDNVWQRFHDFVAKADRSCKADSDCVLVGEVTITCGCYPSLGGSGIAINRSEEKAAQAYEAVFKAPACEATRRDHRVCDAAPGEASCVWGRCSATEPSCHLVEAGPEPHCPGSKPHVGAACNPTQTLASCEYPAPTVNEYVHCSCTHASPDAGASVGRWTCGPWVPSASDATVDTAGNPPHTLAECRQQPDGPGVIVYCCDFCPRADMNASAGVWAQGADGVCLPFCHACLPDGFQSCTPAP